MSLTDLTIRRVHAGLKGKDFSCKELVNEHLDRIKEHDGKIHAVLKVTEEDALRYAQTVDEKVAGGEEIGPLEGVPMLIKDNMLIKGTKTTAGSKILEEYEASYDSTVVRRLGKAGAVVLGKANLDEFAMGSSTENSYFGPTRNPWNTEKIPGGSSGGSAAAVAAGMCVASLGSDTGGSIRQPAAMCGIVGMKPTYGRVSRYGLIAMASSFDQIGPMTRSVEDAETLLKIIEGEDPFDSTSASGDRYASDAPVESLKGLKIGLPKEYFGAGMDEAVGDVVKTAIKKLEELGAEMVEVSLPSTKYDLEVYYVLMPCEVSANLARLDGIRYGYSASVPSLKETYLESRGQGFGDETRRRIMLGTYALSSGYYDAYYLKAQKVRTKIKKEFEAAMEHVDCILSPTSPTVAWNLGEKIDDPIAMYLSDLYTVSANVVGAPAISVPCGFAHDLPVGLQLIGRQFQDRKILSIAKTYEQATEWHQKHPKL